MNAQKINTKNKNANFKNSIQAAIVRGKFYNDLHTDVEELDSSITTIETNVNDLQSDVSTLETVVLPAGGIQISSNVIEYTTEVVLTADEIVGTDAGDIGHANGAVLVASPGAGFALEFISAMLIYDFDTAAYTGGGDDTVIQLGTVAQTATIAGADLLEAAEDKIVKIGPLGASDLPVTTETTLNLQGTALTQPGTAAGVLRVHITYRIHTTNL